MGIHAAYRSTGATLPYGDLLGAHGVAMEGYFWRVTDAASGRVAVALIGVNRDRTGAHWSTLGLAGHPSGFLAVEAHPDGFADRGRLRVAAGSAFTGDASTVRVDLGPTARLELDVVDHLSWPRRRFGGSSGFHAVPALNQYWHPWLLGGRASGRAVLGEEVWEFEDAEVYGEKNWGAEGFPDSWWWGQAHGFGDGACVAFAGGEVTAGPLRTEVTALVVRLPDGTVLRLGNPVTSPVRARVSDDTWLLRGRGRGWRVEVEGSAPLAAAHVLPVPLPSERRNVPGALEHLGGTLRVTVHRGARTVWSGTSTVAALEHGGLDRAAAEMVRRGVPVDETGAGPRPG
ncbi:MAG: tocopherol cyclase family protein [Nocardioides sp.]